MGRAEGSSERECRHVSRRPAADLSELVICSLSGHGQGDERVADAANGQRILERDRKGWREKRHISALVAGRRTAVEVE
jgi:hypothetical protein